MKIKLELFVSAFRDSTGSDLAECDCGRLFWDDEQYQPEDEVLEALIAKKKKEGLLTIHQSGSSYMTFENKEYCINCDCWHDRAELLMGFIDSHSHSIAEYLNEKKKMAIKDANLLPEVSL